MTRLCSFLHCTYLKSQNKFSSTRFCVLSKPYSTPKRTIPKALSFTVLIVRKMDWNSNGEEPSSWEELYSINLIPSELFLKFRKDLQGLRVGINLELYNAPINDYQAKIVLKHLAPDRRLKFIYEPIRQDVRVLSKKIPLTNFLNLQVGVGHSFRMNTTGWKWKLTTCFGGDGISRIRNKTSLGVCPGVDLCFGWRADYVLPEVTGALGTGEALFNMSTGKLEASLDRVECILTHNDKGILAPNDTKDLYDCKDQEPAED